MTIFLIVISATLTVVADIYLKKSGFEKYNGIGVGFILYALLTFA